MDINIISPQSASRAKASHSIILQIYMHLGEDSYIRRVHRCRQGISSR
jgi:hypothetical protein